ncbi:hypothetical protein HY450_00805 [Candidatus Pacearchaeota archaeon]|nr:hypothetical protein [Candidatus Pacearchaeota archaeon]
MELSEEERRELVRKMLEVVNTPLGNYKPSEKVERTIRALEEERRLTREELDRECCYSCL